MNTPNIIPVDRLGDCRFVSPLKDKRQRFYAGEGVARYTRTKDIRQYESFNDFEYFELAGAREQLFFDPKETVAGIVTCGGICPGLNDVIRAITFCCLETYGIKKVLGFPYGFEGLVASYYHQPIELTSDMTDEIHEKGGTILKSSRGPQPTEEIVKTLKHFGVNMLFTIGGDGTQRGARDLCAELKKQGLPIAVVGIPKTIDNDISVVQRTFGFDTAVSRAWEILTAAHAESRSYRHGVGLVKLMGRQSGWIATSATLSNSNVNFCLIPEVPFAMEGPNGFLESLRRRLIRKDHAVIVVAEGAGQPLLHKAEERDRSGNLRLGDIGVYLRDAIQQYFASIDTEVNVKYFDPSYQIRSTPANASDSEYALRLGNNAVHAGMAGKTNLIVGLHCDRLVHLPIDMIGERKLVDPKGWIWQTVLQATRQPDMSNAPG